MAFLLKPTRKTEPSVVGITAMRRWLLFPLLLLPVILLARCGNTNEKAITAFADEYRKAKELTIQVTASSYLYQLEEIPEAIAIHTVLDKMRTDLQNISPEEWQEAQDSENKKQRYINEFEEDLGQLHDALAALTHHSEAIDDPQVRGAAASLIEESWRMHESGYKLAEAQRKKSIAVHKLFSALSRRPLTVAAEMKQLSSEIDRANVDMERTRKEMLTHLGNQDRLFARFTGIAERKYKLEIEPAPMKE